jgi:hypothetical protein
MKMFVSNLFRLGFVRTFFMGNPIFKKKRKDLDSRGLHPLPAPPPIRYALAGFTGTLLNIAANKDAVPIPIGVATAAGRSPGSVIKFGNTLLQDRFGSISTKPIIC